MHATKNTFAALVARSRFASRVTMLMQFNICKNLSRVGTRLCDEICFRIYSTGQKLPFCFIPLATLCICFEIGELTFCLDVCVMTLKIRLSFCCISMTVYADVCFTCTDSLTFLLRRSHTNFEYCLKTSAAACLAREALRSFSV